MTKVLSDNFILDILELFPMTAEHRAAPELWAAAEKWGANTMDMANCILELRDRVAALETALDANSSASLTSSPAGSLVDRVAQIIAVTPLPTELWHDEARTAILEVAAWLRDRGAAGAAAWAMRLEQEAEK